MYTPQRNVSRRWKWLVLSMAASGVTSQSLTDSQLNDVEDRLAEAAQLSWELGTRAQALLEYDARTYSVFSDTSLPPPSSVSDMTDGLTAVFDMAEDIVSSRGSSTDGPQPLMEDGSAADPASNGVSVLLANWTGQGDLDYAGAAQDQLDFLLYEVPRTSDGAISHRVGQAQLWNDFIFMVPPFLAYFGVITSNRTLISEAYNQISLYRDHLRDEDANNLWRHIVEGSGTDPGHWATGNAWAAAGMLRVLATIQRSEFDGDFSSEKDDLASWVLEIHSAMYNVLDDTHIFRNYADDEDTFYDAASTALMAATVYRLSQVWGDTSYIRNAEDSRKALYASENNHFTSNGWLTPVVNPHNFAVEGSKSAEGQAFVLMMQAAHDDWVDAGSPGNDGVRTRLLSWSVMMSMGLAMTVMIWL